MEKGTKIGKQEAGYGEEENMIGNESEILKKRKRKGK